MFPKEHYPTNHLMERFTLMHRVVRLHSAEEELIAAGVWVSLKSQAWGRAHWSHMLFPQ